MRVFLVDFACNMADFHAGNTCVMLQCPWPVLYYWFAADISTATSTVLTPNMADLSCDCKPRISSLVTWVEIDQERFS